MDGDDWGRIGKHRLDAQHPFHGRDSRSDAGLELQRLRESRSHAVVEAKHLTALTLDLIRTVRRIDGRAAACFCEDQLRRFPQFLNSDECPNLRDVLREFQVMLDRRP